MQKLNAPPAFRGCQAHKKYNEQNTIKSLSTEHNKITEYVKNHDEQNTQIECTELFYTTKIKSSLKMQQLEVKNTTDELFYTTKIKSSLKMHDSN